MVFNDFWFCLTISVLEKWRNLIFEMPIILQILDINNLRTKSAKSINLHIIRKLIKYCLKSICVVKIMFPFTVFKILLFEDWLVLLPTQWDTQNKGVKVWVKNKKIFGFCLNDFIHDWLASLGFEWFLIFFILFNLFSTRKYWKTGFLRCQKFHKF